MRVCCALGKLILWIVIAEIGDCSKKPCQNGGVCVDQGDGYLCDCVLGYTGDDCETGSSLFNFVLLKKSTRDTRELVFLRGHPDYNY